MEKRSQFTPVTVEWLKRWTVTNDRGCWIWQRHIGSNGYPNITARQYSTNSMSVHRLIWIVVHGPIPDGLNVLHDCDVKSCINPEHLYIGTQKQNVRDALDRGLFHHSKLNKDDVLFIRASSLPRLKLAAMFGVCEDMIYKVRSRTLWNHI